MIALTWMTSKLSYMTFINWPSFQELGWPVLCWGSKFTEFPLEDYGTEPEIPSSGQFYISLGIHVKCYNVGALVLYRGDCKRKR